MTGPAPTRWRSVLPYLAEPLPPDVTPVSADGEVKINLPVELVRQSVSQREYWDIPEPVVERYRQYRPTPLWRARGFEEAVGARVPIYVKNEGVNISGSHKLNTALAQAYYYQRAGVRELVTGTGAGQWGTAMAAACALFGLRCRVFMVESSLRRKPYRGVLMRMLGAEVHTSPSGMTKVSTREDLAAGNSLSLAIGEAVEYAASHDGVAFCIGSGETYSILHQSVIGLEAADQLADLDARIDTVVGCVGAGSNFGGIALPFHAEARSTGVEGPRLVAAESSSTPKLTRGVYAYDKTDATGSGPMEAMYTIGSDYQIPDAHTAGLRFHGAAKLVSALRHTGDVDAMAVSQADALDAGRLLTRHESVLPAPESGHALAAAAKIAASDQARHGVLVCVSGHGYLDLGAYEHFLAGGVEDVAPSDEALARAVAGLNPVGAPR
ncbi:TrpB-like pyridoxal phosphate-dependent enzyme [Micromonospora sp. WMMD882]|uniref:TrpB-like pyridoxal phosphate-dependent enzyme n=1 Tax=Micromonospora sp. WMMD882 TaxID=3015151 RepID=UPI00248D1F2D|nr:TrpB-like pyridoxal phosphate-dependent enzyme [Micromonospora sp. WMMD882]WBB78728.1 TrpB-like pyridoxal phosphate-dependent enzyme [Micromonospora sp. WMMD882]